MFSTLKKFTLFVAIPVGVVDDVEADLASNKRRK
jgi:hypothetical protein